MNASKQKISEAIQITAMVIVFLSIWGWCFWLTALKSGTTFAELRADPEFEPMVRLATHLSYLAPPALILGIVALMWRPRFVACIAIALGAVGTCWLTFAA
ncbi:MAG: hypothetical protein CMJ48_01805 [Planctomycetaceae bacterium]|nr:hypothetical protein [Planctomycetaceae bacterium]